MRWVPYSYREIPAVGCRDVQVEFGIWVRAYGFMLRLSCDFEFEVDVEVSV